MSTVKRTPWGTILRVVVAGASAVVLTTLGFNCAPALRSADVGSGDFASLGMNQTPSIPEDANFPKALMNYDQMFQSMLNVTEQTDTVTADQRRVFTTLAVTLPEKADLATTTAAALLSAGTLAGEVCQGLLTRERNIPIDQRRYFLGIDFTRGPSNLNIQAYRDVVTILAQHFWGRAPNEGELKHLEDFYNGVIEELTNQQRNATAQTSAIMQGTCAAMLASLDSVTY